MPPLWARLTRVPSFLLLGGLAAAAHVHLAVTVPLISFLCPKGINKGLLLRSGEPAGAARRGRGGAGLLGLVVFLEEGLNLLSIELARAVSGLRVGTEGTGAVVGHGDSHCEVWFGEGCVVWCGGSRVVFGYRGWS